MEFRSNAQNFSRTRQYIASEDTDIVRLLSCIKIKLFPFSFKKLSTLIFWLNIQTFIFKILKMFRRKKNEIFILSVTQYFSDSNLGYTVKHALRIPVL